MSETAFFSFGTKSLTGVDDDYDDDTGVDDDYDDDGPFVSHVKWATWRSNTELIRAAQCSPCQAKGLLITP